jgi:hypothetical protein
VEVLLPIHPYVLNPEAEAKAKRKKSKNSDNSAPSSPETHLVDASPEAEKAVEQVQPPALVLEPIPEAETPLVAAAAPVVTTAEKPVDPNFPALG